MHLAIYRMKLVDSRSWHARLFVWARGAFGQNKAETFDAFSYVSTVILALVFVLCAAIIWVVLNAGTLLFGVYAEPVWRSNTRFHVLFLPGRIPIVAIAIPVLLGFALWRSWLADGVLVTAAPFLVTIGLGFGLFGAFVAANTLRRKLPPWSLK